MARHIKRLGPGDEAILSTLAAEDADFDVVGRGTALDPLDEAAAQRYLADPAVLHWIAEQDGVIVGELSCIVIPLSAKEARELLLYEIGVRNAYRRLGVGRELIATMEQWMRQNEVAEVWVLADNAAAQAFYRDCGFGEAQPQPVYMTRRLAD